MDIPPPNENPGYGRGGAGYRIREAVLPYSTLQAAVFEGQNKRCSKFRICVVGCCYQNMDLSSTIGLSLTNHVRYEIMLKVHIICVPSRVKV